ncbi:hypothetical protein [Curtobacterium sp. 9128]|uniref:hypothetical protein n=1 Tax=Curtobacterium sp. 9128 TaxID=1793722 RepID=UPI0011A85F69|nr:hypothetical protein [Curtobacterium sp. 9128]
MTAWTVRWGIVAVAVLVFGAAATSSAPLWRLVGICAAVALGAVGMLVRPDGGGGTDDVRRLGLEVREPQGSDSLDRTGAGPDVPGPRDGVDVPGPRDGVDVPGPRDGQGGPGADAGALRVGQTLDGLSVTVDRGDGVLVVGRGALATGVFAGVAAALGTSGDGRVDTGGGAPHELRLAAADDVELPRGLRAAGTNGNDDGADPGGDRTVDPDGDPPRRPAPRAGPARIEAGGVAVAVLVDGRGDRVGSVVLVPDLRWSPRARCPTITVTRYGCRFHRDPDRGNDRDPGWWESVELVPALPALDPPDLDPPQLDQATLGHAPLDRATLGHATRVGMSASSGGSARRAGPGGTGARSTRRPTTGRSGSARP